MWHIKMVIQQITDVLTLPYSLSLRIALSPERQQHVRKILVRRLGWTLLAIGKPFTRIGNWFWRLHRTVLKWID